MSQTSQKQAARVGDTRKQAQRPAGRRARQREEQALAARRHRLTLALGGLSALVVVAIVVVAWILSQAPSSTAALADPNAFNPTSQTPKVGSMAPGFDLATIDGTHYSLSAQRGHPVLLEFFAVWCPHCQREAPLVNTIDKTYGPKGLRTFSILASPYGRNYDSSGETDLTPVSRGDVTWFEQTFAVKHPILIDPKFATVNRYLLGGYPTFYILDSKGVIRYTGSGEVPLNQLTAEINKAFAS